MDTPLEGARHMKGKQVAVTLYLSPRKYWLLKALSHRNRVSMQKLLRQALEQILREDHASIEFPILGDTLSRAHEAHGREAPPPPLSASSSSACSSNGSSSERFEP